MPCAYRIDSARRIVFSRASGVVTESDLRDHRARLAADPDFDPSFEQLFDFSDVTGVQVSSAYFRQRAIIGEIFDSRARRAFVTPDDAVYGSARAFLAWLGNTPNTVRLFRDMGEARQWLGLEETDAAGRPESG
jgi:hypothetical protein